MPSQGERGAFGCDTACKIDQKGFVSAASMKKHEWGELPRVGFNVLNIKACLLGHFRPLHLMPPSECIVTLHIVESRMTG